MQVNIDRCKEEDTNKSHWEVSFKECPGFEKTYIFEEEVTVDEITNFALTLTKLEDTYVAIDYTANK